MTETETAYQRMKREAEESRPDPEGKRPVRPRVRRDPKVAKARAAEKTRRYQEASRRAVIVLKGRFPEEWAAIFAEEQAGVDSEKGPLPGDEIEEGSDG